MGKKTFHVAVLPIAPALFKRNPDRLLAKAHLFIAVAYFALAFYAAVLLDFGAWTPPLRPVTGILLRAGIVSAVLVLTQQVGRRRKVTGTVEGLYGGDTLDDTAPPQIWISGVIGAAPLIAQRKRLARKRRNQQVNPFHTTSRLAPEAREKLPANAQAAGVNQHIMVDDQDGILTGDKLRAAVPDWKYASVWFRSPARFGEALHRDLAAQWLLRTVFHQELTNTH